MILNSNVRALHENLPSTSTMPDLRSGSDLLASATPEEQTAFLGWVVMGGRGAGKTRAGAEWIRSIVEGPMPMDAGRAKRVALVAETYDQARDVMIFGDSGIMACTPLDRRPKWSSTKRRLEWLNGAVAEVYSASSPEALRGPQFDAVWVDELAKWQKGQEAWDMLQFGLRLGDDPRQIVTTTPRLDRCDLGADGGEPGVSGELVS